MNNTSSATTLTLLSPSSLLPFTQTMNTSALSARSLKCSQESQNLICDTTCRVNIGWIFPKQYTFYNENVVQFCAVVENNNPAWRVEAQSPWRQSPMIILYCIFVLCECTCRWMKTTEPRRRHVPPWRSTCSIRKICRKRIPLENNGGILTICIF